MLSGLAVEAWDETPTAGGDGDVPSGTMVGLSECLSVSRSLEWRIFWSANGGGDTLI